MKRITVILIIITCCKAMVAAQSFYTGELSKTIGTAYRYPAIGFKSWAGIGIKLTSINH